MTKPLTLVAAITFEPDALTVERVCRQLSSLSSLCAVYDNSTTTTAQELVDDAGVEFGVPVLRGTGNRGTAGGINELTRRAVEVAAEWLTYFDQDTILPPGFGATMPALAELDTKVAAVGSLMDHQTPGQIRWSSARFLIASGTSWRVQALVDVDGCDQDMFLDVVDQELCLRLRLQGWRLVTDQRRLMHHPIGDDAVRHYKILVSTHPLWRRQLMWRNTTVLARRYARTAPVEVMRLFAGRAAETLSGMLTGRGRGWATAAREGFAEGRRASRSRRGLTG